MKVLIYYPWIYLKGGIERVILETIKRSRHSCQVVTHFFNREHTFADFKQFNVMQLSSRVSVKRDYSNVARSLFAILTEKLQLDKFDAMVVHCDGIGNMITLRNHGIPCYCYCHTPLRPSYDDSYRESYLAMTGNNPLVFDICASAYRAVDALAWRNYKKIICNSAETKKRLLRFFPKLEKKVSILHPGIDAFGIKADSVSYGNFFLIAGRIMWTKNIQLGIKSFILWKDSGGRNSDFKLVIAGFVDNKSEAYLAELKRLCSDRSDVVFIVCPSDIELRDLYRNCYAVLFTPFNEDWGLIPLEAGLYKKTTVAVDMGGPKESIVNGQTGFLTKRDDIEFSQKIAFLVEHRDETIAMGMRARNRVVQYDWKYFIEQFDREIEATS